MGTVWQLDRHPAGSRLVTLGILAHDARKDELDLFARAHLLSLRSLRLIAPEDTAFALAVSGVEAQMLSRESWGGDLQLASAFVDSTVDAVIFLRDPLFFLSGDPDIAPMLKVCDCPDPVGHEHRFGGSARAPTRRPAPAERRGRTFSWTRRRPCAAARWGGVAAPRAHPERRLEP